MNITLSLAPIVSLLAGILILVVPRLLNYIVAIYLIIIGLLGLFGGRQSARTIHFLACFAFIGFVATHLFMVATSGLRNNIGSMITGWFRTPNDHERGNEKP